jgi:hypothetical protein
MVKMNLLDIRYTTMLYSISNYKNVIFIFRLIISGRINNKGLGC